MKRLFSKKDQEIRKAFQIYDSAKAQSSESHQGDGPESPRTSGGEMEQYLERFEESGMEERIYRLIEKLPIENPKRKARRIWICGVAAVVLCILAGCMVHYAKQEPVRMTRALQEVYRTAGERCLEGQGNSFVTSQGIMYQCFYLTQDEEDTLKKSGISYRRAEGIVPDVSDDFADDLQEGVQAYRILGRKSQQFILLKDRNQQTCLGKFIGYKYWWSQEALLDSKNAGKMYGMGDILEKVMGIESPEDIRSITLERSQAVSKEEPDRMVAMWTGEEEREWMYDFFHGENRIWSPAPKGKETAEEKKRHREEGMAITSGKYLDYWKSEVLAQIPEQAFYLEIENQNRELLILGLLLEGNRAELWLEPLVEWSAMSSLVLGQYSGGGVLPELSQAEVRNGVVCLSMEDQKLLSDAMRKVIEDSAD